MGYTISDDNRLEPLQSNGGLAWQGVIGATVTSVGAVAFRDHRRVRLVCLTGDLAAGATVTFRLLQSTNAAKAGGKAIGAGKTVTFTDTEDNATKGIDVNVDEMDVSNGFNHVYSNCSEGGQVKADIAATLEWRDPRYAPASRT